LTSWTRRTCRTEDGYIWYCGEGLKDLESFDDDDPRLPELVSTDDSFKAGVTAISLASNSGAPGS
jgi:hypothetical protein